jgi:hypothetical protein
VDDLSVRGFEYRCPKCCRRFEMFDAEVDGVRVPDDTLARIEFLEKALTDAADLHRIVTLQPGDAYCGSHRYQIGDELIVCGSEVLYRANDCPQLTEWMRARVKK